MKGLNLVYLFQSNYEWLSYICVKMRCVMKGLKWVYLFSVQLRMVELYLCYNEVCYEGT